MRIMKIEKRLYIFDTFERLNLPLNPSPLPPPPPAATTKRKVPRLPPNASLEQKRAQVVLAERRRLGVYAVLPCCSLKTIVDLWYDDPTTTEALYGAMEDWDTSELTTFKDAFMQRQQFVGGATFTLNNWEFVATNVDDVFASKSSNRKARTEN